MASTRNKKNSLLNDMGIDQKDFQDLFLLSLQDESFKRRVKTELGHDELLTEISTLRAACQKKDSRISELERHSKEIDALMDALEQYSRGNSMRIDGIKENDTECLIHTVLHLFNTRMQVSPPLLPSDIDRVHRVGRKSPGKNRTVLVKFTTGIAKDKVYRVRSNLKPDARSPTEPWKPLPTSRPGYTPPADQFPSMENPNATTMTSGPETTGASADSSADTNERSADDTVASSMATNNERSADDLGNDNTTAAIPDSIVKAIGGKIFLNDDLTNTRNYMLYIARQAKRRGAINDVWVVNGMIKIKDLANTVVSIREMANIPDHGTLVREAEARRQPNR